jgi:hypothetical protein
MTSAQLPMLAATLTRSYKEVLLEGLVIEKLSFLSTDCNHHLPDLPGFRDDEEVDSLFIFYFSKCYTDSLVCIRPLLLSNRPALSPTRFNIQYFIILPQGYKWQPKMRNRL